MNEHYEHYLVPERKDKKEKKESKEKRRVEGRKPMLMHIAVRNMLLRDLGFTPKEMRELESILGEGPIEKVFGKFLEELKKAVKSHFRKVVQATHPDKRITKRMSKRLDDKYRRVVEAKHFFDKVSEVNQLFEVEPLPANVEGPLPYDYDKDKKRPGEGWQIWGPDRL